MSLLELLDELVRRAVMSAVREDALASSCEVNPTISRALPSWRVANTTPLEAASLSWETFV